MYTATYTIQRGEQVVESRAGNDFPCTFVISVLNLSELFK
jgi:hypothetical protein